jgi:hypothetical protein
VWSALDSGAASGGTGGVGAGAYGSNGGGGGGSTTGGSAGWFNTDSVNLGGAGGTAALGGFSIGGGGGGSGQGDGSMFKGGAAVGGIYNAGTLLLSTSTVSGNIAAGGGGGGSEGSSLLADGGAAVGGIRSTGTLTLDNSSVTGNAAAGGGGGGNAGGFSPGGQADNNLRAPPVNQPHTGGVSLSGTATQGQTLTAANTLVDADGLGTVSYQWTSDGTNISGATAATFILTQAQVGHVVAVTGSYTDGGGFAESATSSATAAVANVNDAHTGGVSIAGTPTQGQVLTASNTLADADGLGTISYQWKADGTNISGATASTLTLGQAQVGHAITVAASYTDGGSTAESATSTGTASVANINDAPTGAVTISGTATQGQVLTAGNTLADADGLGSISYQWKSDGANISGATSSTFTLASAQVGHVVTVAASYTDGGGAVEQVTSAATSAVGALSGPTASVATLAELKAALAAAASDGIANVITLTADISATSGADFASGTGGRDLLKIAVTDGHSLSIVGGGHILDANYFGRALEVSSGTVAISDLTIREGGLAGDGGAGQATGGGALGAGIYNSANLTLTNVTVTASAASGGGGGYGGGYGGGGGGGGGAGSVAGHGGGGAANNGYAASGGTGGAGGKGNYFAETSFGGGGSSQGGAGGQYSTGHAGAGGTAHIGSLSVGGGGGGAGGGGTSGDSGAGGAAVGGIYNSATGVLQISGGAISGNVGAGGGAGGASNGARAADGGVAVGGLMNAGHLNLDNVTLSGNAAAGGVSTWDGHATSHIDRYNTGVLNTAPTGGVAIAGTATQGQVLTASNTLADADGLGAISYQWKSDGSAITGATAASYTLTSSELGKHISVTASYIDGGGASESATSTAGAAVTSPVAPPDPGPPAPVTSGTTIDGAAVSTTTTVASDGSQTHTIVVQPVTAARPDSAGGASTADIPLVTVNGDHLITIGLPTGTGLSASGSTTPGSGSAAQPSFIRDIDAGASTTDRGQIGDGANAFLQAHSTTPVLVQTLTLSGVHTDTPIAINGSTLGSGVTTALVIDTHNLSGQTQLTLDNVDFAAVIGAAHITGGAGAQTVYADGATQYMVLGADNDELHGGGGNDTVGSAGGDDSLYGDDGNDSVFGGIGRDAVNGGSGDDVVQGNQGDDMVQGNAGNDRVYGGQGNDIVHGGQGDDQVWGDLGDDLILGDRGNDTLTGGAGADTFIFEAGHGADRITDFRQAEGDHIQLAAGHGAYTTAQVGADTVLDFGAGNSIVLANVQLASLANGWILG